MAPSAVTFTAYLKPVQFLIRDATVVYEPSVFGGDGSETRVNVTLRCDDASVAAIRALEGIEDFSLVSAVKQAGVRAKMDKTNVIIYDANGVGRPLRGHATGDTTSAPAVWRGAKVNALLVTKGTWKSRSGTGICLECTSLQMLPTEPMACPF